MIEVSCQGANLTRIFAKFATSQSPFAEVEHCGEVVGRTRPHEGGDRCPRWNDEPILLDSSRGTHARFRVLVEGVLGQGTTLCGEGTVDLRTLHQQQSPYTVPLQRRGESTGFLQFAFVSAQQAPGPEATAAAGLPMQRVPTGGTSPMLAQPGPAQPGPAAAHPPAPQQRGAGGGGASPAQAAGPCAAFRPPEREPAAARTGPPAAAQELQAARPPLDRRPSAPQQPFDRPPPAAQQPLERQATRGGQEELRTPLSRGGATPGGPAAAATPLARSPASAAGGAAATAIAGPGRQQPFHMPGPRAEEALSGGRAGWPPPAGAAGPPPPAAAAGPAMAAAAAAPGQAQTAPAVGVAAAAGVGRGLDAGAPQEPVRQRAMTGGLEAATQQNLAADAAVQRRPAHRHTAFPLQAPAATDTRLPLPAAGGGGGAQRHSAPQLTPAALAPPGAAPAGAARPPAGAAAKDNSPLGGEKGGSPSTRLSLSAKGQQGAAVLMQSKDRLREFAERPFLRPEMRGRSHLGYAEFRAGLGELLRELEMTVPEDAQILRMFEKHRQGSGSSGGVGREEFEALIFRLLCFMLASGEVAAKPAQPVAGEERDKRWREEFLKKNSRSFSEVYLSGRKLGEGSFGAVYEVAHRSELEGVGRQVRVCKVIKKAQAERAKTPLHRVREEFAVLKRLDHPHVVRIFEDFEDEQCFYLVMEPCRGGDLMDAVKNPCTRDPATWERFCAKVMQHTLSAVAYCHSRGVIHKDLKPENVMMSSDRNAALEELHVVVVDFGLAQMFSGPEGRATEVAGTPPFMAPEVWAGNFSKSCDVWSCGVMLFFMLSGTYPFMAQRLEDFPRAVAKEPNWQLISGGSGEANLICWKMLCKTEADRPNAQELLRDIWFKRMDLSNADGREVEKMGKMLMQVKERTHFEKFVTRLVATQLDAGQLKRVNEAFRAFDADRDGTLSAEELLRGLLMLGARPEEAQRTVAELDVGRTGRISYTEFLAGVVDLRQRSPEERHKLLWLAWQQFNPDKRGHVRTSDVQDALAARGMTVTEMPKGFLRQLSRKKDPGSSGVRTMTFEEFKTLFQEDESCCMMGSFIQSMSGMPAA